MVALIIALASGFRRGGRGHERSGKNCAGQRCDCECSYETPHGQFHLPTQSSRFRCGRITKLDEGCSLAPPRLFEAKPSAAASSRPGLCRVRQALAHTSCSSRTCRSSADRHSPRRRASNRRAGAPRCSHKNRDLARVVSTLPALAAVSEGHDARHGQQRPSTDRD